MDMGRATCVFYPVIPFFQKAYLTLTSQQCGPGWNPGVDDGVQFIVEKKPTLPNSNSIWNARTRFNEFLTTPRCSVEAGDFYYQKDQPSCVIHWKEI